MSRPHVYELRAVPNEPGEVGEIFVAALLRNPDGSVVRCAAAPLLAGSLAGLGRPVRLGEAVVTEAGAGAVPGDHRLALARSEAVGAQPATPSGPQTAVLAAGIAIGPDGTADQRLWPVVQATVARWARAMGPREIHLASPRAFCAGVERAIDVVDSLLERNTDTGRPVYVRKQIVHNLHVVRDLENRGAVFVDELDQVPDGAVAVFSAHGVAPEVRAEAVRRGLEFVDATCPMVSKVHAEARRYGARGDAVVLIGKAGHDEAAGTLGQSPNIMLVERPEDVAALPVPADARVSYLTQTTLALDDTTEIIDALGRRFEHLDGPGADDICYATTNRQEAVRAVAVRADVVVVFGSANSHNSTRLVQVARRSGTPAHLAEDLSRIQLSWIAAAASIGLTSGASAPPALVHDAVDALRGLGPVTVYENPTSVETIRFAPPAPLRKKPTDSPSS